MTQPIRSWWRKRVKARQEKAAAVRELRRTITEFRLARELMKRDGVTSCVIVRGEKRTLYEMTP